MKKMLFLLNPNAGKAEIQSRLMAVLNLFTAAGYDVTVHPTQGPNEIPGLLKRMGGDYDRIVCSGGDGTLNETVAGLMELKKPPVLGYIPAGTVNDFASALGIPRDILAAADTAVNGQEFLCDVARFNRRYFTYVAAFGAFTDVSYRTSQAEKHALGRAAYLLEGVKSMTEIRPFHTRFQVDGQWDEADVIYGMVSSATSIGGFKMPANSGIQLDDGLHEVILVHRVRNLTDFNAVVQGIMRRDFSKDYFQCFQTDRVAFEFDEAVPWTLDGEFGGGVRKVEIQNLNRALKIMVPKA